ncbi:DUF305 domain-containing protein [Streptomyces sp. IB2014 016-6]|uniref:DUF305 domain-containing protein n=1 Tax=Streptomyces sp. IB2014 016-6 TaxID=2517818 RepID=UPI0011C9816B|nr:DUF305 domain-containing protein [Streptomyces sp. IB2014 016-6]TXL90222.1 DUF305 domain-containing protein [Streptomyces sp. IB2014 016-6]
MKAVRGTAAALLALLVVTGCSSAPSADRKPPAASTPVQPGPVDTLSGATDAAWIQLMTPMNEGAVELLTMAADRAGDPRLRSWASDLATAHRAELGRMRPLLKELGLPSTNVHEGHEMPGMVTPGDLTQARAAEGAAFEKVFVVQIREHLEHSARVSRSEIDAGSEAAAKKLAAALVEARRGELAGLRRITA